MVEHHLPLALSSIVQPVYVLLLNLKGKMHLQSGLGLCPRYVTFAKVLHSTNVMMIGSVAYLPISGQNLAPPISFSVFSQAGLKDGSAQLGFVQDIIMVRLATPHLIRSVSKF